MCPGGEALLDIQSHRLRGAPAGVKAIRLDESARARRGLGSEATAPHRMADRRCALEHLDSAVGIDAEPGHRIRHQVDRPQVEMNVQLVGCWRVMRSLGDASAAVLAGDRGDHLVVVVDRSNRCRTQVDLRESAWAGHRARCPTDQKRFIARSSQRRACGDRVMSHLDPD